MFKNRKVHTGPVAATAAALLMLCATGASAGTQGGDASEAVDLPIAKADPGASAELIESLPRVVQELGVLIDDSFEPGMPIVYPDGTPVEGQSPEATRAAVEAYASCSGSAFAPGTGSFGPASVCSTAVFGHPGYDRGYSWHTGRGITTPRACAQGRGYTSQGISTWYSVSCGTSTGGSVFWGNVLGNPALRAQSLSVPLSFAVSWVS